MGQSDIMEFLEKNPKGKFTKKEIERCIKRGIKNYSIKSMAEHGDIYREIEIVRLGRCVYKICRYSYSHNNLFSITNFRKR